MTTTTLDKIKFKATDEKPCQVTLSVQIPAELVQAKKEQVASQFQRVAQLPGFRAGKVPLDLVKQNFSEKIHSEALEQLLKDSVPHILKEKALSPVSTPMVDKVLYGGDQALSFDLIIERSPKFTVKDYKKIPVVKKVKKITDDDVQRELSELAERNSQLVPSKAEKAEKQHFAAIRYEASSDGKSLPEFKAENQLVNLSAPQTIQGFAEGILGLSRGETKEIKIDFPKEYPQPALAGKPVTFKVTLEDIKEKQMPALDDEFAKDFEMGSLEELKAKIRESLQSNADKSSQSELEKQIIDALVKENPIPVPESLVDMQLESMMERAKEFLTQQGIDKQPDEKTKELKEKYRPQAERQVQVSYLLSGIAKQESLAATADDLRAEMEKAKLTHPEQAAQIEQYFAEHDTSILNQMTDEKVIRFLIENAKIKETTE